MLHDVVIVGGGPAGLSAALAFGRSRRHVLVCDGAPRRNAAAEQVHNFVTRDGTPPDDFRRIAREQLAAYPSVEVRDVAVEAIAGTTGAFRVAAGAETVAARRVLLCTGMVDETLPLEGFRELWGHAIFQCPYCHGWEVRDRRWGYLAREEDLEKLLPFALKLRAWTADVTVFTDRGFDIGAERRGRLAAAGIEVPTAPVRRLLGGERRLEAVELADGARVPCEVLFAHPPQRQVPLVESLALALEGGPYVRVDPLTRETSTRGIYAAGDLTARAQAAIFAAAAGTLAATAINVDLALEVPAPLEA